ncbi:MAG: ribonuclease P protein component [Dehalococcoidia bacterium]|nr:ribonuclease P protein component [Dehalococcoidia bacterium]
MEAKLRLTRRKDFSAVFRDGHVWGNRLLAVRAGANGLDHNRYGFIISKRLGKAVVRNKIRRRLKEGIRSQPTRPGWDVVVSARPSAAQANFQELRASVSKLLGQAGILGPPTVAGRQERSS